MVSAERAARVAVELGYVLRATPWVQFVDFAAGDDGSHHVRVHVRTRVPGIDLDAVPQQRNGVPVLVYEDRENALMVGARPTLA